MQSQFDKLNSDPLGNFNKDIVQVTLHGQKSSSVWQSGSKKRQSIIQATLDEARALESKPSFALKNADLTAISPNSSPAFDYRLYTNQASKFAYNKLRLDPNRLKMHKVRKSTSKEKLTQMNPSHSKNPFATLT